MNPGTALRVLTVIIAGLFTSQMMTAQEWYSSDWLYRMPVEVPNPGTTHLSGFQVQIILTGGTGGNFDFTKPLSDGSDIRVTSDNGVTLIPFWIEGWGAYGEDPRQDTLWVKVPNIPAEGATVYIYYGNSEVTITDPAYVSYYPYVPYTPSEPVEMPPSGPYTKHPDNPIVPIGRPAGAIDLLAENIVYDDVTGHYWMVLSDQSSGSNVSLVYSDDPTNPDAWYWPQTGEPAVPAPPVILQAIAPHILKHNGRWYIFYGDRSTATPHPIAVRSSESITGPYTIDTRQVVLTSTEPWELYRVDEPYVFQRNDGKWILMYMANTDGGNNEQVGYAVADNLLGPYIKFNSDDPEEPDGLCIPLGFGGTFDAGTVADPWVIEHEGIYYIGYTVSPGTSGWSTALATTTDWETFTPLGIILDKGTETNSFRGAVTRIGDQYVFAYTGDSYDMRIATQPVYITSDHADPVNEYTDPADPLNTIINDPEAVFDFYDGFDGDALDTDKWDLRESNDADQIVVGDGSVTLTSASTSNYVKINATSDFGFNYIGETRARHPNTPAVNMIVEYGFSQSLTSFELRITDNFSTLGRWQWYNQSFSDNFGPATDTDWHIYSIYRQSPGTVGFMIGASLAVPTNPVPTADLSPFLMSFGTNNQFIVDWTRVRKWAGADPSATPGTEEPYYSNVWTGNTDTDWHTASNWTNGIPDNTSNILIPDVTNQPLISEAAACNRIVIDNGATLEIAGTDTLTVSGDWINSGGTLIQGTGDVVFNGTIVSIGGSSSTTFNNLTIGSSVSTTLDLDIAIDGNLTVTTGTFDLGSHTCDRTTSGGVLELAESTSLMIGGANTSFPANFSTHALDVASIVEYYGENQVVASSDYGILVLSGSGDKTFPAVGLTGIGTLSIHESTTALLPDGSVSSTDILILGGAAPLSGSYGSTSSAAVNQDDTYFTAGYSGIINHTFEEGMWLGASSTNWHDASNWFGGVPDETTNVVIQAYADHQPVVVPDSPVALCADLTINEGASLTISAGEALTVDGDLSNSGTLTIESDLFANGSLIVTGTSTGSVTYNRRMNTSGNLYHYFSSPLENSTFPATGTVWAYDEVTSGWPTVTSFISGKGYTLETGIDLLTFTGTLVEDPVEIEATSPYSFDDFIDGTELNYDLRTFVQSSDGSHSGAVTRSLTNYGGGGWNLLGNPYTSAISVSDFITANYNATPSLSQFDPNYVALYLYNGNEYFWAGIDDGWLNGTGMDQDHIQVAQGFFALAMNDASTFTFTRSMQEHASDVLLLKSANVDAGPWPGVMLRAKYGNEENSTLVVYNENMTAGLDPGYDVGLLSSGRGIEIYTTLAERDNSVNFTRQALPINGADKLFVPIGIDSENGGEVTFSAVTVPLGNNKFWLEDRTTGIFTDLSSKTYTVTIPAKSYGTGRFYIIASTNTPTGTENIAADEMSLRIWNTYDKVVVKGKVSKKAVCELYNVKGEMMLKTRLIDGEMNTIDIPSGLKGVFMVRVVDGPNVTTRKIAIL